MTTENFKAVKDVLTAEEAVRQIEVRQMILPQMVGQLYPAILLDEIDQLHAMVNDGPSS